MCAMCVNFLKSGIVFSVFLSKNEIVGQVAQNPKGEFV